MKPRIGSSLIGYRTRTDLRERVPKKKPNRLWTIVTAPFRSFGSRMMKWGR